MQRRSPILIIFRDFWMVKMFLMSNLKRKFQGWPRFLEKCEPNFLALLVISWEPLKTPIVVLIATQQARQFPS